MQEGMVTEYVSVAVSVRRSAFVSGFSHTGHIPLGLPAAESRTNLLDLEPRSASVSGRGAVHLGHVKSDGPLVVNSLVGGEGDGRSSGDGDGSGFGARAATDIAAEIVGCKVGNWRIPIRVLANVLVQVTHLSVYGQELKDVFVQLDFTAVQYARAQEAYSGHAPLRRWLRAAE